jgi:hypothetical protein
MLDAVANTSLTVRLFSAVRFVCITSSEQRAMRAEPTPVMQPTISLLLFCGTSKTFRRQQLTRFVPLARRWSTRKYDT